MRQKRKTLVKPQNFITLPQNTNIQHQLIVYEIQLPHPTYMRLPNRFRTTNPSTRTPPTRFRAPTMAKPQRHMGFRIRQPQHRLG